MSSVGEKERGENTNRNVRYKVTAVATAKSLQCPTLCDPIDGGPPGSSIPGILQARTMEWVAVSFSSVVHESEK